jgi:hypothetical protein
MSKNKKTEPGYYLIFNLIKVKNHWLKTNGFLYIKLIRDSLNFYPPNPPAGGVGGRFLFV